MSRRNQAQEIECLTRRAQGQPVESIARDLGVSVTTVGRRLTQAARRAFAESAETYRAVAEARLDALTAEYVALIEAGKRAGYKGSYLVDRGLQGLLSVEKQRCAMFGYAVPQKVLLGITPTGEQEVDAALVDRLAIESRRVIDHDPES